MALNLQLPPIFDGTPEAIAPAEIVAEFPVNTFLENIAIAKDGTIFLTSYEEGKVYKLNPGGEYHDFAKIDGNFAGIAIQPNGNILVAGALKGGISNIWQIQPNGSMEVLVALPDAIFLNGMTHLRENVYLVADSYKGVIWAIDAIAKTAEIWVQDLLLARSNDEHPFPAVNGIKIYQNALFASNTQRQILIRIPIEDNGTPGKPEEFLTNVNLDDFAFDLDGNLYGTTHVYNSTIRITPQKEIATIAKAEQGMTGNTAVAFGCTSNDKTCIYITTNGGMSLPPETGLEPAKVVRLEVGVAGV